VGNGVKPQSVPADGRVVVDATLSVALVGAAVVLVVSASGPPPHAPVTRKKRVRMRVLMGATVAAALRRLRWVSLRGSGGMDAFRRREDAMSDHHHHDTRVVETTSSGGVVFALVAIVVLVLAALLYFAVLRDDDGDIQIDVKTQTPTTQQSGRP
jgi:hypothetical protein